MLRATDPMEDHQIQKTRTGLDRIARAFDISMKGLRAAWLEKAFRQEVVLSVVLVPLALAYVDRLLPHHAPRH